MNNYTSITVLKKNKIHIIVEGIVLQNFTLIVIYMLLINILWNVSYILFFWFTKNKHFPI